MSETTLAVMIFNSPAEAPAFREPEYLGANIDHANIVKNGTKEGKSTVDLVFESNGQKFVVLTTGRLIRALAQMIGNED